MTPERAHQVADAWRSGLARGMTTEALAAELGVTVSNLYGWRRKAERTLGITLETSTASPSVAARVRARAIFERAMPPLPAQTEPCVGMIVPNAGIPAAPTHRTVERGQHRKHYIIPDLQLRRGVPTEHLPWIGADIARRRPDVVVLIGDVWDFPSLSSHELPGSMAREGLRYEDDVAAGMEGMELLMRPVLDAMRNGWSPRLIYTEGNHEFRIMRAINADPRYAGTIGPHQCNVERFGFERHNFLEVVNVDGIAYSHYFQMAGSNRPIGGSMDNRLNKICGSFVQGHEQGLLQHRRPLPTGKTIHGVVCGSAYLHSEDYRGPQRNNEWRGTVVLHDVRNDGDCDPMPLTLQYLAREYGGVDLHDLMAERYPNLPRGWAA